MKQPLQILVKQPLKPRTKAELKSQKEKNDTALTYMRCRDEQLTYDQKLRE